MMKVLLLGDVHAQGEHVLKQFDNAESQCGDIRLVLQAGDFGLFKTTIKSFPKLPVPLYFVRGNHETFHYQYLIPKLPEGYHFLDDGDSFDLNGQTVVGVGRSHYIDVHNTPSGSTITDEAIEKALRHERASILLTHDSPLSAGVTYWEAAHEIDVGSEKLDRLWELHPRYWFFGHHHKNIIRYMNDCLMVGLGMAADGYCVWDTRRDTFQFVNHMLKWVRR